MNRTILRLALVAIPCCTTIGCASPLRFLEDSIVFQPRAFRDSDRKASDAEFEDAVYRSADGVQLHGWFAEAEQPTAVVLYCHGNAGNIAGRRWVLRLFREYLNASILVFDYRGYGNSEGKPSESGILADARASRRWLAERTGVKESDIVIVGNSLGGAVAVDLASNDGARALVLENTFTSLPEVASKHFFGSPMVSIMHNRLDSASKIKTYRGPLLQTHRTKDGVVPFELGKGLFEAANEPKKFIAIPEGGHNDLPTKEYLKELKEFLESVRRPESRPSVQSAS